VEGEADEFAEIQPLARLSFQALCIFFLFLDSFFNLVSSFVSLSAITENTLLLSGL